MEGKSHQNLPTYRSWPGPTRPRPVDRHVSEWASFKNFLGRGKIGEENLLEHCGFIILDRLCRQEVIGFLRLQGGSDIRQFQFVAHSAEKGYLFHLIHSVLKDISSNSSANTYVGHDEIHNSSDGEFI